jgi:glutathione synthase/RimK-type ligase-like ATP-grasp enzyme
VKLILANNHNSEFVKFYSELQARSREPFDYSAYESLLFMLNPYADTPVNSLNLATKRWLSEYGGVYINGYLSTYELAAATAITCESLGVGFVNKELSDPPSLSKLTMYAKLAAAKIPIPVTIAGSKSALLNAELTDLKFPAVLKRADADRGIDNFKVDSTEQIPGLLRDYDARSLWVLQEYVPNEGFYLVSFYGGRPEFCFYRSLEERPDKNELKAHMYKPKGGHNAALISLDKVPKPIIEASQKAVQTMNRQIASVDSLLDEQSDRAYVLEVNYNPQLVTINTFKDERIKAFLDYLQKLN